MAINTSRWADRRVRLGSAEVAKVGGVCPTRRHSASERPPHHGVRGALSEPVWWPEPLHHAIRSPAVPGVPWPGRLTSARRK